MKMGTSCLQQVLSCACFSVLYCSIGVGIVRGETVSAELSSICARANGRDGTISIVKPVKRSRKETRSAIEPNEVFVVGDYRDVEVAVPKRGFHNGPIILEGYTSPLLQSAQRDEDFNKTYMRMTVADMVKQQEETIVCLRVNEIDVDGNNVGDSSSHYAYVVVGIDGCKVTGYPCRLKKDKEGSIWQIHDPGVWCFRERMRDHPFLLLLTCPPVFSCNEFPRENGRMHRGEGVVFLESTKVTKGQRIKAAFVKKVSDPNTVKPEEIKYYSSKDKTLSDEGTADSTEVLIHFNETQTWMKPDDWVWESMERVDSEGHVVLRCKQIRRGSVKEKDSPNEN